MSAHDGRLWIAPTFRAARNLWEPLHIKGTNWAGAQANGCPHQLWRHTVGEYISFLTAHNFNAVRLPLSAWMITHDADTPGDALRGWAGACGDAYLGWRSLRILEDVVRQLRDNGILVALDMHSLYRDGNDGSWCGAAEAECDVNRPDQQMVCNARRRSCPPCPARPILPACRAIALLAGGP